MDRLEVGVELVVVDLERTTRKDLAAVLRQVADAEERPLEAEVVVALDFVWAEYLVRC